MKFYQSPKLKISYQFLLFLTFIILGILTYPSQLATMLFFIATMGAIFIVDTLVHMFMKKKIARIGLYSVVVMLFFFVTYISLKING